MSAIGQALRKARKDRGITTRVLAAAVAKLGHPLSHAAIANKERGGSAITPQDRKYLTQAMGMTLDDFDAMWRGSRIERTDGDESGRKGIPVINRAPAGMVVDYTEHGVDSGQGFEYIERGSVDDELAFAVIVVGVSMEPSLYDGDYVIFSPLGVPRPRATLEVGKVVFVRTSPDSKRVGCFVARYAGLDADEKLRFTKDNPKNKPVLLAREAIEQLAVAVEKRSRRF